MSKKIRHGYRLVKFSEVNTERVLRGTIINTLLHKGYFTNLQLDGGQISSYKHCGGSSCDKPKITFTIQNDEKYPHAPHPQHAIMIGK